MICVLDVYEIANKSPNPTKFAFCYCNVTKRFANIRLNKLMSKTGGKTGKKWRKLCMEQCTSLEMYLNQFSWSLCPKGYWRGANKKGVNMIHKHRLIWEWHNGDIPSDYIVDHIDQNPQNNQIENLRLLKRGENRMNSAFNNKSGHRYISPLKTGGFRVKVRTLIVRNVPTLEEAIEIRNNYCMYYDQFAWNKILDDAAW